MSPGSITGRADLIIRKQSLSKQVLGNPGQELKTQKGSEMRHCGTWKVSPERQPKPTGPHWQTPLWLDRKKEYRGQKEIYLPTGQ